MDTSDGELLIAYRQGRVDALEQLVERYRRPLFGFILNLINGTTEEADEIFQEVWFRAIKHLDQYRDDRLISWLFRIARNLVIDRYRTRKDMVSLDRESEDGGSLLDTLPAGQPLPGSEADYPEWRARIGRAVSGLPRAQREVFLMRLEADLPFKEIARIQGVSINTALARMQYALAKLRDALRDGPRDTRVAE